VTWTVTGGTFLSYIISSSQNAFEFADNVASCQECAPVQTTPLPAALPLLLSAVGGMGGLLGWRNRRKKKAVTA
jgi:hypothetical protein